MARGDNVLTIRMDVLLTFIQTSRKADNESGEPCFYTPSPHCIPTS